MKKSITLFAVIIGAIATIIFSCKRVSVPIPATSCIQVALSSAASTTSQTVAVNTPIAPIAYAVTGSITGDTAAIDTIGVRALGTLPPGITGTFSGGVFTLSGTPTSSVGSPFTYTVTTTGSSCSNVAITGSITVNSISTVTVPANIAVCNGSTVAATSFSSIPAGATYTWTNSNTAIGLAASGTGNIASFTATNVTHSPITATITVTPTTTQGTGTSNAYTITVNPVSTMVLSAGTPVQTISTGTAIAPSITYTIGGSATGATLTGTLPAGVTGAFAAGLFTISGTPTSSAGSPYNYTVTTTGNACTSTLTGTITVTP